MKEWVIKNKLYFIGAVVGAIGGFFWWKLVGCNNGQCMISSKPLNSMLYFAFLGTLVFSLFKSNNK